MRDRNGVPERDPNPPIREWEEPVCPECRSEELGLVRIMKSSERIIDWYDKEPCSWDTEDRDFLDYGDPKYYCFNCGERFDRPDWEWREG